MAIMCRLHHRIYWELKFIFWCNPENSCCWSDKERLNKSNDHFRKLWSGRVNWNQNLHVRIIILKDYQLKAQYFKSQTHVLPSTIEQNQKWESTYHLPGCKQVKIFEKWGYVEYNQFYISFLLTQDENNSRIQIG